MFLYSVLGVSPLPQEKSSDWTVLESWSQTNDDSYKLVIESATIGEECRKNPASYVVFQGVNLSINSIYIDNKLHESNNPMKDWVLSQVFYRPVVHCKYIQDSKVVRQEVIAFLKYMGALTEFPSLVMPSFGFYFVHSDLFYVSALIVILLTIINTLIVSFSGQIKKFRYGLLQDVSIVAVLLSISPGKFFEASVITTNESYLSFLLLAVFCMGHLAQLVTAKRLLALLGTVLVIYGASVGNKNLIQLITLLFLLPILIWLSYTAIKFYQNLKHIVHDKSIYLAQLILVTMIPLLVIYESYVSTLLFNKFVFLPVIFVMCSLANFLHTIRLSGLQKYENYVLKDEIRNQLNTIQHLVKSKNKYEEIIHDIKSPLTGLSFALSRQSQDGNNVLLVLKDRLGELLSRSEVYLREDRIGWHEYQLLEQIVRRLRVEYSDRIGLNFSIESIEQAKVSVDPVGFKVVLAELLDNSYKAGIVEVKIYFQFEANEKMKKLMINYTNGQALQGRRRESIYSSGKGLGYLITKVESWGGVVVIDEDTFDVTITLECMS